MVAIAAAGSKHSLDLGPNTPRWSPSKSGAAEYLPYDIFMASYPHLKEKLPKHKGNRFEDADWKMYVNWGDEYGYNIGRSPKSPAALAEHQRLYAEREKERTTSSAPPEQEQQQEEQEEPQNNHPHGGQQQQRLISVEELFDLIAKFREFLEKEKGG